MYRQDGGGGWWLRGAEMEGERERENLKQTPSTDSDAELETTT